MMYKEKFVAVVKCNGSILREIDGVVTLPFGSEYTLLLKNLDSRKASVKVNIDGQDVIYNSSLIIGPNTEVELKGFLKDGLVAKNGFKFIQKTKEVVEHRGDKLDDGLIRIEFTFEKKIITEKKILLEEHDHCHCHHHHHHYHDYWRPYWYWYGPVYTFSNTVSNTGGSGFSTSYTVSNSDPIVHSVQCNNVDFVSTPLSDEGITVPGSIVNQQFYYGSIGELEEMSNVIVLRLRGTTSVGIPVEKPIEVKTKVKCPTCGRRSKSSAKFCSGCGTGLV